MTVHGAIEAATAWLGDMFPGQEQFGRLEMISAFSEGAKWAERQRAGQP